MFRPPHLLLVVALLSAGALRAVALDAGVVPSNVPSPGFVGTRLTWEECVRLAAAHNPSIEASRQAIINSDAVRRGAYSTLYPQISLGFTGSRNYSGPAMPAPSNYSNEFNEQATLSQTIFNGFLTEGNIAQAHAQLNLAFANFDAQKAATSYDLKSAFAQLLYAQKLIGISQNVIKIRQDNAHLVKLLYDSGNEDKGAWLLSEANLDLAQIQLNTALRNQDVSVVQLLTYIAQPLPGPVEAEGELVTELLPTQPDFRALAVQTPAYFQKTAQVDAAAAGITIAQSGFYPTVDVDATAGRGDATFLPRRNALSGGFTVSYPIFEGGATYFNVAAARASLRESLAELQSGTDQASLSLAQNFKTLVDAVDNRRVQEELLEATGLRYKIAEAQYRNGLTSFQDFDQITDSYVDQQAITLAAQRDAVIAEANWEQARGLGAIP